MIQRKQSLFLFFAVISLVGLVFLPLANFFGEKGSWVLYTFYMESKVPDAVSAFGPYFLLPLLSIIVVVAFIALVAIFMFKNRKRQMMLVRFAIFMLIVEVGIFFLYYVNELEEATGGLVSPELGIYLIPLALIWLFLALRGIIADEKLIRSADRLR